VVEQPSEPPRCTRLSNPRRDGVGLRTTVGFQDMNTLASVLSRFRTKTAGVNKHPGSNLSRTRIFKREHVPLFRIRAALLCYLCSLLVPTSTSIFDTSVWVHAYFWAGSRGLSTARRASRWPSRSCTSWILTTAAPPVEGTTA